MYITPADQNIAVQTFHVIPLSSFGPPKAYFFATPYTLTFSEAFKITKDQLLLANKVIEQQYQEAFIEKFNVAKEKYLAEQERLEIEAQAKRAEYQKSLQNSRYHQSDKESKLEILRKAFNSNN